MRLHVVASHFRRAGDVASWIRCAEAAADGAVADRQFTLASHLLMEVLGDDVPRPDRPRLAGKLASAALEGLEAPEAISIVQRILADEGLAGVERGRLRLSLGWLLLETGDDKGALAQIQLAVADLEDAPALQARGMATLAMVWSAGVVPDDRFRWLDRAEEAAARAAEPAAATAVLVDRAFVEWGFAFRRAAEWAGRLPAPTGEPEHDRHLVRGRLNLGHAAFHAGHYVDATRLAAEGLEMGEAWGVRRQMSQLRSLQLLVDWACGRWSGLAERAIALREEPRRQADPDFEAGFVLGALCLAEGSFGEAQRLLDDAAARAADNHHHPTRALFEGVRARLLRLQARHGPALDVLVPLIEVCRSQSAWPWAWSFAPELVEAFLAEGDETAAAAFFAEFKQGIYGLDAPAAAAAAVVCEGAIARALGDPAHAADAYGRAARMWYVLPRPQAGAWADEAQAECLFAHGSDAWQDPLRRALTTVDELGAAWEAARIRRTMRRLGMKVPRPGRSGRKSYGGELSPREREVAGLAAQGATNEEIAATLCLSPRTVQHHLGSAMRKIGVTSRRALIPRRDLVIASQK